MQRTQTTQWNREPWTLGAFSAASPGVRRARTLMEPIRDRVFFAGEAVHETLWGTVGGAWESGERAAETVVRAVGGGGSAQGAEHAANPASVRGQAAPRDIGAVMAASDSPDRLVERQGQRLGAARGSSRRQVDVVGALTTVTDAFGRVSVHGLREELLLAQLDACGLPPAIVRIPYPCPNEVYEREMAAAMARPRRTASPTSCSATCSWRTCAPIASSGLRRSA